MPFFTSEAVILHTADYAEWDKIVSLYTKSLGRIKGIAKGAKRSQKRFGSALEPFTHTEVSFFERETHGLARLEHCRILNSFSALGQDITRIAYGNYFLELVNILTPEREKHQDIFHLLIFFLELLSEEPSREDLLRLFELRLTSLLGYRPQFLQCVNCTKKFTPTEDYRFSIKKGGILCAACHQKNQGLPSLSTGTIKLFQQAQHLSLVKLNRIHFSPAAREEGKLIFSQLLEYHLGKKSKSLNVLEKLIACG